MEHNHDIILVSAQNDPDQSEFDNADPSDTLVSDLSTSFKRQDCSRVNVFTSETLGISDNPNDDTQTDETQKLAVHKSDHVVISKDDAGRKIASPRNKLSIKRGLSRSLDETDFSRPHTAIAMCCKCQSIQNLPKVTLCLTVALLLIALIFAVVGIVESTDNLSHAVPFFVVSALFFTPGLCQLIIMWRKRKTSYSYGRMK